MRDSTRHLWQDLGQKPNAGAGSFGTRVGWRCVDSAVGLDTGGKKGSKKTKKEAHVRADHGRTIALHGSDYSRSQSD